MQAEEVRGKVRLDWPPLLRGRLIKRYKRFLADVMLDNGEQVTAHCPNSGRMTACNQPGQPVFLSQHNNPKRKLKYSWEMIEMPTSLVGVNTLVPNRLAAEAFRHREIPGFENYDTVLTETSVNAHTRLDLKLAGPGLADCYVEVKNCTLVVDGAALFPDAPTVRGRKHLQTLIELKRDGFRAAMFFMIQRRDARYFAPAESVDPEYGTLLRAAAAHGVELMAFDVDIDLEGIGLGRPLPCRL